MIPFSFNSLAVTSVILGPKTDWIVNISQESSGGNVPDTPNLEYLLSQGVLLLNTDLTTKVNKTGSHEGLWEPFQKYFLEEIMSKQTGIVYILSGNTSLNMEKYISPLGNYILKIEHPANAERRKREWKTENIFNNINKLVKYPIIWNSGDYDDNPPF